MNIAPEPLFAKLQGRRLATGLSILLSDIADSHGAMINVVEKTLATAE